MKKAINKMKPEDENSNIRESEKSGSSLMENSRWKDVEGTDKGNYELDSREKSNTRSYHRGHKYKNNTLDSSSNIFQSKREPYRRGNG